LNGASVMLNGFASSQDVEKLRNSFQKGGIRVGYHGANLMKADEIVSLIQTTQSELGSCDILINNAGIQYVSSIEQFPAQKWDDIIAVNLTAVFHTTKHALPMMRQRGYGRILNVSSVHGLVASVNKSAYVAAKHGVMGLTKTTALETAGSGVTCNAINPGWVLTPLVQAQIDAKAQQKHISVQQATEELLSEKQPSKQFVTAEHIGQTALFLCSEAASQITGIAVPVDGGWTSQ